MDRDKRYNKVPGYDITEFDLLHQNGVIDILERLPAYP